MPPFSDLLAINRPKSGDASSTAPRNCTSAPSWFDEANGYARNAQPGELDNLRDDLGKKNRYAEMPEKVAESKERPQAVRVQVQVR